MSSLFILLYHVTKYLNVACWLASVAVGLAFVVGLYDARGANTFSGEVYHPPVAASVFYNGFGKAAWAVALGWVVFACVKGYGGEITLTNFKVLFLHTLLPC